MPGCKLKRLLIVIVLAGAAAACQIAGCSSGEPRGQVAGRVTFRGQSVTEGTVNFSSEAGEGGEAALGPDGQYEIKSPAGGLPLGEYSVTITPALYLDNSDPRTPPVMEEKASPNIPEKYRRAGGQPFRWTVKEGPNEANFDMLP